MNHARPTLTITLRTGTDMTGATPTPFPELLLSGNEAGLRHLCREIDRLIRSARTHPDAHTHLTGRDGPHIATSPANLMLTIECTREDEPPLTPAASASM